MGLSADHLHESLAALAAIEPAFARGIERVGLPAPRISERGYATLLRTIVGQQVSVASARRVWGRLETVLGDIDDPASIAAASDDSLRAAGLSAKRAAMPAASPDWWRSARSISWRCHRTTRRQSRP